jgi:hypothetical protein
MAEEAQVGGTENLSFEEALGVTQEVLNRAVEGELPATDLQHTIAHLVTTENGARGFFVMYLGDPRSQMDDYINLVVTALKTSPAVISSLLVKNLAMSTAMILTHQRHQKAELVEGSERVRARSLTLIQQLQTPQLQAEIQALAHSVATATGDYQTFLERWRYDAEQRQAIAQALQQTGLVTRR